MHVGHTAGVGCVSGWRVGGGVVRGGGIGWRVGGVVIRWRLRVSWDGNFVNTATETSQGKIGQDSLHNEIKMPRLPRQYCHLKTCTVFQ